MGSDLTLPPTPVAQNCGLSTPPCSLVTLGEHTGNPFPEFSPTAGVVTGFRIRTGAAASVTFRIVRFQTPNSATAGITGAGTGPTASLPGAGTFSFPAASLPIKVDETVGIDTSSVRANAAPPCDSGGGYSIVHPVLTDGGPFQPSDANSACELLVSATVEPSNAFKVGKLKLNKERGTGTIKVTLPGPGDLIVAGKNVQGKQAKAIGTKVKKAGAVTIKLKPVGRGRKKMRNTGKVASKLKLTFTPTGGTQSVRRKKVTLKKS